MTKLTMLTMCALAAAAMAAPAFAATNMYLELGPIKGESSDRKAAGGKVQLSSIHFSATRKGWDGTIKPVLSNVEGGATSAEKFGAVGGTHRDDSLGTPTGKRQHQPNGRTAQIDQAKPLDQGSVTVNASLPGCTVGAAYADAVLQAAAARYELKDVQITSCAPDSVSLNYAKVQVRGWNPEKKED